MAYAAKSGYTTRPVLPVGRLILMPLRTSWPMTMGETSVNPVRPKMV